MNKLWLKLVLLRKIHFYAPKTDKFGETLT